MFHRLFMLAIATSLSATPVVAGPQADLVERGAYLARIMDCAGCHMPRDAEGAPMFEAGLSGGNIGFELPGLGIFWPPNLTSSPAGLAAWTDAEIVAALRKGVRPDGRVLVPVMPWPAYAGMAEEDMDALVAWLRTLPAIDAVSAGPASSADTATAPFYRVTLPQN